MTRIVKPIHGRPMPDECRVILSFLDSQGTQEDAPNTQEIAQALGFQFATTVYASLASLHRWGYVQKMGIAYKVGRSWLITESGRAALSKTLADANSKPPEA